LVLGTSAGHGALTGMFADLIIMSAGATLFTAGPPLVKAALGIETTPEALGNAAMHTGDSGVAHQLGQTEQDCLAMARYFLALLPTRSGAALPDYRGSVDCEPRAIDGLLDIIPPEVNQPYDMHRVLAGAEFILGRGGASTLAEVAVMGVPAWVVPYPHHADEHQAHNARLLGSGVQIVPEATLDGELAGKLARMAIDTRELASMRTSLAGFQSNGASELWRALRAAV
ncbi:MAG: carboxyl transferase domain-containing protein, partial [Planctomycetota bacterium]|nr:carboxyl transferase domain-containing protein [Planctomycetota bacterium]